MCKFTICTLFLLIMLVVLNTSEISGQYDQSIFVENPQECNLVPVIHNIHYPGCATQSIESFSCQGMCDSYVKVSSASISAPFERSCSCCQHIGQRKRLIRLECPNQDPPYREVMVWSPVECACRLCSDFGTDNIKPHELIEVLEENGGDSNDY